MKNPSRCLVKNNTIAVKQCKYGPMLYNINDSFIGRSLEKYGEWSDAELSLLEPYIQPADVVLDIGANIGTHTVFFAQRVTISGRVYAFEPQRLCHQKLCANVALNDLWNVDAMQVALGASLGQVKIPAVLPSKEFNFGGISSEGHISGEIVQRSTVDHLNLGRCKLMKIDVEGNELSVLQGAKATIERCHPILFLENNREEGSKELINFLEERNYTSWWHLSEYFNPVNHFKEKNNIFERYRPEANLLCCHKSQVQNFDHQGLIPVDGNTDTWIKAFEKIYNITPTFISSEV
jgi:FkbM family methyltransferase